MKIKSFYIYAFIIIIIQFCRAEMLFSGNAELLLKYSKQETTGLTFPNVKKLDNTLRLFSNFDLESEKSKFALELWVTKNLFNDSDIIFLLDQAYYTSDFGNGWSFLIGKKRYNLGMSYFWSPTFAINTKRNYTDPDRNCEGVPIAQIGYTNGTISPKIFCTLGDVNNYADIDVKNTYAGMQLDLYYLESEIYLNGIYNPDNVKSLGLGFRKSLFEFTGQIEGAVINGSQTLYCRNPSNDTLFLSSKTPSFFTKNEDDFFYTFSVALNRKIFTDGFFIVEFYHDTRGYTDNQFNDFWGAKSFYERKMVLQSPDALNYKNGYASVMSRYNPGFIRQNYLFFSYTHSLPKWEIKLMSITSLDDTSAIVYPSINWKAYDDFQIEVKAVLPISNQTISEYGLIPLKYGLQLRVRKFF